MWLRKGVLVVVLPERQMNNLGKGKVVGNFDLAKFLLFKYIKIKSSENYLLGVFLQVLKEQAFSKVQQDFPPKHSPLRFSLKMGQCVDKKETDLMCVEQNECFSWYYSYSLFCFICI